jgi:hypothetical protein
MSGHRHVRTRPGVLDAFVDLVDSLAGMLPRPLQRLLAAAGGS